MGQSLLEQRQEATFGMDANCRDCLQGGYLANKTRFREDILSNRIEEIVLESFQAKLGKSVGSSELSSWKNSLRHIFRF